MQVRALNELLCDNQMSTHFLFCFLQDLMSLPPKFSIEVHHLLLQIDAKLVTRCTFGLLV